MLNSGLLAHMHIFFFHVLPVLGFTLRSRTSAPVASASTGPAEDEDDDGVSLGRSKYLDIRAISTEGGWRIVGNPHRLGEVAADRCRADGNSNSSCFDCRLGVLLPLRCLILLLVLLDGLLDICACLDEDEVVVLEDVDDWW